MKNLFYTFFLTITFFACQNTGQSGSESSNTAQETATAASSTACYIRAEGRDTTYLNLTIEANGDVSGTYDWIPFEKDSARGTFSGKKEGEIIKAVYDYIIEGSQQQQELMLKMSGDQLAEAEGELVEAEGGLLKLKDPSNVRYLEFTKVTCQ